MRVLFVILFALAHTVSATLVPPSLSYIAENHDNDNTWEAVVAAGSSQMLMTDPGGAVSPVTGSSNFAAINAWFSNPNFTHPSLQDSQGNPVSQTDATFEFVLRPVDFAGNHTIFDTGGNGDGTALVLVGNTLEFRFQDANTSSNRLVLSHTFNPGDESNFHHVVGTVDVDSAASGTGAFYVNGGLSDGPTTTTSFINDWDGGDDGAIGGGNTNIPGGLPAGHTLFDGDFAVFNFYTGTVMDQSNVNSHFAALMIPEPQSGLLLFLGLSILASFRRRR